MQNTRNGNQCTACLAIKSCDAWPTLMLLRICLIIVSVWCSCVDVPSFNSCGHQRASDSHVATSISMPAPNARTQLHCNQPSTQQPEHSSWLTIDTLAKDTVLKDLPSTRATVGNACTVHTARQHRRIHIASISTHATHRAPCAVQQHRCHSRAVFVGHAAITATNTLLARLSGATPTLQLRTSRSACSAWRLCTARRGSTC